MLLNNLLPGDWRKAVVALHEMNAVRLRAFVYVVLLNGLRVVTELFGIVLIFPILKFIEHNGDLNALRTTSRMWGVLINVFSAVALPVNLITLSGAVFIMILARQVVAYYSIIATARLKESVSARLSSELFKLIMAARGGYIQDIGSGAFVTLINAQCHSTGSVVVNMVNTIIIYLTLAVYGGFLLAVAPVPAIVAGIFGAALVLLMRPLANRAKYLSRKLVDSHMQFGKCLGERYQNWRLVKLALGRRNEDIEVYRWNRRIADINVDAGRAAGKVQLYITPLSAGFLLVGLVVLHDYARLSLADLTIFLVAFLRLLPSFENLMRTRQALANLSGSLFRVREAFSEVLTAQEPPSGTVPFTGLYQSIEFQNVRYTYPHSEKPALDGLSLVIKAGTTVALTGPSGGGKSTLVDMIPRILIPDAGCILIDGIPIDEYRTADLRREANYVTQQTLIFDASVADNLRHFQPDASIDEIRRAAIAAHADEFIRQMPQGYDTPLGEAGLRLSGGQRQRIVLARAFLTGASILILDEPTSALDFESERQIRLALDEIRRRNVTVIVIAHRWSTIRNADRVVVLQNGRIIEQGTPNNLLSRGGWYAEMAGHADRDAVAVAE